MSRDECLYGDALVVRDKAQAAGVPVTWLERGAMPHVWPIMVPWLPEARADVKKVIRFVREHAPLTLAR
ncbi:MAG: hypothetical protein LPK85_09400 [Gammaproteobacteria bacterium]|nr:hypothetical protein [Gammaproteobacteria bacterium]